MYKQLTFPEFKVTLNGLQIESGFYVEYQSSDDDHANQCILTPYGEAADAVENADLSEIIVEMGCQDDYETILEGTGFLLQGTESILVKDPMIRLERTLIQETFLDCYPDEILRYILTQCGVTEYRLSEQQYERKAVFTVRSMNAVQAIKEMQRFWGTEVAFYFWDGVFYWGCEPEQNEIYELDDNNILDLEQNGDVWTAEILAIPWLHQGQYVLVTDSRFCGLVRIKKCVIKSKSRGSVDMYIQFVEAE